MLVKDVEVLFESSVNSYDSQTRALFLQSMDMFESSVNSYDSQTVPTAPTA